MNSLPTISIRGFGALLVALAVSITVTAQEMPLKARAVFHLEGELSKEASVMTRYVTLEPRIQSDEAVAKLARVFGLEGKVEDRDRQLIVKEGLQVLEVFRGKGTGYIRYSDNAELAAEKAASGLPQPDEAAAKASELLKSNGLLPENAMLLGTRYAEFEQTDNKGEVTAAGQSSIAAIFGFELDGKAVLGPGAKAGVVFGNDASVIGASLIWRETRADGEVKIMSPADAFERFKKSWPPEQVEEAAIVTDIHIETIDTAYYAAPGIYPQDVLEPVYAFSGFAELKGKVREGEVHEKEQFRILIPATGEGDRQPVITTGPSRALE
ncbi:MAG: hypothetical protein P8Z78_00640 [Gammaproteobacteria bacterium]|jgi:hypothetical protein